MPGNSKPLPEPQPRSADEKSALWLMPRQTDCQVHGLDARPKLEVEPVCDPAPMLVQILVSYETEICTWWFVASKGILKSWRPAISLRADGSSFAVAKHSDDTAFAW